MIVVLDTETTGKPRDWAAPVTDVEAWPRLVQIAWLRCGSTLLEDSTSRCAIIRPEGFDVPAEATAIHGITDSQAREQGQPVAEVLADLCRDLLAVERIVGHNLEFDCRVLAAELIRIGRDAAADYLTYAPRYDTMLYGTPLCLIPGKYGYKWPRLAELYRHLFGREPADQHRADGDVRATAECYFEMVKRGHV